MKNSGPFVGSFLGVVHDLEHESSGLVLGSEQDSIDGPDRKDLGTIGQKYPRGTTERTGLQTFHASSVKPPDLILSSVVSSTMVFWGCSWIPWFGGKRTWERE